MPPAVFPPGAIGCLAFDLSLDTRGVETNVREGTHNLALGPFPFRHGMTAEPGVKHDYMISYPAHIDSPFRLG